MKLLVIGDSEDNYVCTYHEAFRRGLVQLYNTTLYGKGYPNFNPALKTYREILTHVYPDGSMPDLLLAGYDLAASLEKLKFEYAGLEEIDCPKAVILSDWWKITDNFKDAYPGWLEKYGINYVLCQHIGPIRAYADSSVADRFVYFPVCVDPQLLNDWHLPKRYDVGFLGCGIAPFDPFYPEREAIHKAILARPDISYFWKAHPGYSRLPQDHPLIGKNFSQLINQCHMFIVTGSWRQNTFGKYFEVPASGSLMLATHADGAVEQGLLDGVNYVKITPENVIEKIEYYRAHAAEAQKIAEAGYRWAMSRHSIYTRAEEFFELARKAARPSLEAADIADDYEAGKFDKIADTAERLLRASPGPERESYAHYLLGNCRAQLKKHTAAADSFKAELASYRNFPEDPANFSPFASEAELMHWFHLPGSFNRHLPLVYTIAVATKAQTILDMGIGFSTRALRTAMLRTDGICYSCDMARERFKHLLEHQDEHWKLFLDPSEIFLNRFEGPVDFALHDAAHDYKQVRRDLELLLPKMRRFGIIAVHDTQYPGLNKDMLSAVRDATANFHVSLTTMPYGCGLTLIRLEESRFPAQPIPGATVDRDGRTPINEPMPHPLLWRELVEASR